MKLKSIEYLKTKDNRKNIFFIVVLSVFIVFAGLVSCPFSPLYSFCAEPDEICYLIMSKGILNGKVPYLDLFDHKGPALYLFYIIGLLISGGRNFGIFIVFTLIAIVSVCTAYQCVHLFCDDVTSLLSVVLILILVEFATFTKPDHLCLMFIMLSAYILCRYVRTYCRENGYCIKLSDMLKIGVLCGFVFMVKVNLCIYYFCFIGTYLLWLLLRKKFHYFFKSTGCFLSGIILTSMPFIAYLFEKGALVSFFKCYFVFNVNYASNGINTDMKASYYVVPLIMFICTGIYIYLKSKNRLHVIILLIDSVVVTFVLLKTSFLYSIILLLPIFLIGTCFLSRFICKTIMGRGLLKIMTCLLIVLLFGKSFMEHVFPATTISFKKSQYELDLERFNRKFENSTCLYFNWLCLPAFYDYTEAVPDFRYFYTPQSATSDIILEQIGYVENRIPDAVEIFSYDGVPFPQVVEILKDSGYVEYTFSTDEISKIGHILYIRSEYMEQLDSDID